MHAVYLKVLFFRQLEEVRLNMRSSNKIKKKSKKWYDEDLYAKRRILNTKANLMFKQPFDVSLRNSYFKHYREYRKLLKFKRKNYTKSIFSKLDDLETNDPKTYWNLVNSLKAEQENTDGPELAIDPILGMIIFGT